MTATTAPLRPAFILSFPRSGSTMFQTILGRHPEVATTPEPWFMLVLATLYGEAKSYGEFNTSLARAAFRDLEGLAEERGRSMEPAARAFATTAYQQFAEPGNRWFLDKTPRNAALAPFLARVFPDARFILLWRDPRDIVSSIIRTWGAGRWNLFLYEYDLVEGARGLEALANEPQTLHVAYENLVTDPGPELAKVERFLELESSIQPTVRHREHGMGDRTGDRYGSAVSSDSIGGWSESFKGRVRAKWLTRYLETSFPFEPSPYDRAQMLAEVRGAPDRTFDDPTDLALVPLGRVWPTLNSATGYRLEDTTRTLYSRFVKGRTMSGLRLRPR